MQNNQYTIKTMKRQEVDIIVDWAAQEGWNPGLHDATCYFCADPNGFFIGLLDDQPIASICAIRYGESFGFLGFYIVKPEFRGKGYGIQIWKAGLNYLEGRNVGLDGVVAQQDNYKKSGFKIAYRNIRYKGVGGGTAQPDSSITRLSMLPVEAVLSYDRPFFPTPRSQFIHAWINQPDSHALGIMQDGRLAGYGVIRQCRSGCKIGPLFADAPELAERLFLMLRSKAKPSEAVYLDVPELNHAAVALAKRHHMTVSFETARMYTKETPDIPLTRLFGVTSFEIG
jgi:ribosomal protein S18 acetylase RimI-like enzyme